MVELKNIKSVYFIGIGGIGMSALARYFHFHGRTVSGYDKTETPLTQQLVSEGIPVHYEDNLNLAPQDPDLIVYTPAVPASHKELTYFRAAKIPKVYKRSEVLGIITQGSFNICVAGTHGKTTITTMVAHLLRDSGYGCNAFLGGVSVNYNSNYWSNERNVCVVEADEYDRSFLRLSPDIAIITAMDADHLDIYGTAETMEEAFIEFSGKIKTGGLLISKFGLKRGKDLKTPRHLTYHLQNENADVHAANIKIEQGSYRFDVVMKDWTLQNVVLHMGGFHNVENIIAAIAVAHELGIEDKKIIDAVAAFKGVKRRFEYIIKATAGNKPLVFIDDYAHHPEELRALITGAKGLFPKLRCTVIFQPHLFSRTRDFAAEFAESLNLADEVLLLPIYPARELPVAGVTSELIAKEMEEGKVTLCNKEELIELLNDSMVQGDTPELLITAGAGDIDALVQPIKKIIAPQS